MPWKVVERKIGRAGGVKQRTARQREWDRQYGEENWTVGYVIGCSSDSNNNRTKKRAVRARTQRLLPKPRDERMDGRQAMTLYPIPMNCQEARPGHHHADTQKSQASRNRQHPARHPE